MGVTAALMATSAAIGAVGSITQGIAEKQQAEQNARIYDLQAANINAQKSILAGQYRNKQTQLRGAAVAGAAKSGLRISGTTAQSISQSITQLQLEQSYQQYNLDVQRQNALANAELQRYRGRNAFRAGLLQAGTTALSAGANFYGKYWNNTSGNSLGTSIKHFGSVVSNGWNNLTTGTRSTKSPYAMYGLPV